MPRNRSIFAAALGTFAGACALALIETPCPSSGQGAPASTQQTYLLRYKYAEGESYQYSFTIDTSGTATAGATTTPVHTHEDAIALITYHDISPDGGQAAFSCKYLSLSGTVGGIKRQLSATQLQALSQMVPSVRVTQTGKLESVGSTAAPGALSQMMSSARSLQGAPLPDGAEPLGGVWRGVTGMIGASTYVRSTLANVSSNAAGDQIATISQKFSEQSRSKPTTIASPQGGSAKYYIYETGAGEQKFDNTLGALVSQTLTLSGKVTVQRASTTIPVRTQTTTTLIMQLMPTSPETVAATGKPLPVPMKVFYVRPAEPAQEPPGPPPPPVPAKPAGTAE